MNTRRLFAVLMSIVMLTAVFGITVSAAIPDKSESFYVYDESDVISSSTENHIVDQNDKLCYSTGAQIVIAAVKTTGETAIRDYAKEMFTAWGIGDGEKSNGVLVLLAIDDDDYWVTQGSGIEDKLTSGDIKVMIDNLLEPSFAAKNYDKGVLSLFNKLITTFEGIYDVTLSEVVLPEGGIDPDGNVQAKAGGGIGSAILTGFVIVVVVVLFIFVVMTVVRGMSGGIRGYYRPSVHIPPGGRRHPPRRQPPRPGMGGHRPGEMGHRPGGPRPGGMSGGPRPGGRPSGMGSRPGGMGGRPSGGGAGRSMGGGARPRSGGGGGTRGGGAGRR